MAPFRVEFTLEARNTKEAIHKFNELYDILKDVSYVQRETFLVYNLKDGIDIYTEKRVETFN